MFSYLTAYVKETSTLFFDIFHHYPLAFFKILYNYFPKVHTSFVPALQKRKDGNRPAA